MQLHNIIYIYTGSGQDLGLTSLVNNVLCIFIVGLGSFFNSHGVLQAGEGGNWRNQRQDVKSSSCANLSRIHGIFWCVWK